MKAIILNLKLVFIYITQIIVNAFSNDLVLNAGQHNYFEMFLTAFTIECKTFICSIIDFTAFTELVKDFILLSSLK